MGICQQIVRKVTFFCYSNCRFGEFLEFLLDRDVRYDDEHWSPYFKDCSMCQIDYNFIGTALVGTIYLSVTFGCNGFENANISRKIYLLF